MNALETIALAEKRGIRLPPEIAVLAASSPKAVFFNNPAEILSESTGGTDDLYYDVKYDIPGRGEVTEVILNRVTNAYW